MAPGFGSDGDLRGRPSLSIRATNGKAESLFPGTFAFCLVFNFLSERQSMEWEKKKKKKTPVPSPFELSLLQVNFHSNAYVAPAAELGICYSNSAAILPRVCCFVRGCAVPFQGSEQNYRAQCQWRGSGGPNTQGRSSPWILSSQPQREAVL